MAEISRSLVGLHKECYGKGPTKARTYVSGDLVVCILKGGFTEGERALREAGRADAVVGQREAFQEALRERFIETIEHLVGQKVVTYISGVDPMSETCAEIFLIDSEQSGTGDEREAITGWGEQVRRQSRALREEQIALREAQAALRREHEATRQSRGEDGKKK